MTVALCPNNIGRLWLGLSTDPKPTAAHPAPGGLAPLAGDLFFTYDLGLGYVYEPSIDAWAVWPALAGGGGGGGGNVFVTNFPATQAVSAASLPLPTGAATQATLAAVLAALGSPLQAGGAVSVSNFPATQPVSAVSLPLPTGAATAAGISALETALGSPMQQTGGSVSITGTPTMDVGNFPATQPVSGTVAVSNFPATQPISAVALPLPTGAATNAELIAINTTLGSPLQAGGTVDVGNFPATQAISAAALPLPAGASTAVGQAAIIAALGSPMQETGGSVSIAGTPTVDVGNFPATQPVSGTVAVSNFPVTQPVSIAATVNVDVTNFPATQAISAAALPLPTGAATAANQPALNIDGGALAHVTNFPATQPVSGTVAVSNLPPEGQALSAASLPVVIASDQSAVPVSVSAIALPANAAQEAGGNLDQIAQLTYINRLILAELRALRMMHSAVMTGGQIDPNQLQDTILN